MFGFLDEPTYSLQLWRVSPSMLEVTKTCPLTGTETEHWNPLNTNAAEVDDVVLSEWPTTELDGMTEYVPMNGDDDTLASWSWSLQAG